MRRIVLKFGGASVTTPKQFSLIAKIISAQRKEYDQIVIVVSAMGNTTDQLIALAKQVHPSPPRREYDMLLTVGERISIALLAMALAKTGQEAVSLTGSQSGIITTQAHTEARIIDVRPKRIIANLKKNKVVIVAGFQGVSTTGEITTLGRGGSDTTAVGLGVALDVERVEFYKDVPGIFEQDPKSHPQAKRYSSLSYEKAVHLSRNGAKVLHPRCIELAKRNNLPLFIRSFLPKNRALGTLIENQCLAPKNVQYEE